MMSYEEYIRELRDLERQLRESRKEEGKAKTLAVEECHAEHRRLKGEMHEGIQRANRQLRARLDEIHDFFAADRTRLWERHNRLSYGWKAEHGIMAPLSDEGQGEEGGAL